MSFGGWGEPDLPTDISEIPGWFKGLGRDHHKPPEWVYPFVDILMEQKDKVEFATGRYRKFNLTYLKGTASDFRTKYSFSLMGSIRKSALYSA